MDVVTLALAKKGAKSYTDTVINNLPKGVVYKGSVNYYADLPSAAALGDCYTVAYKGTTGTEPYGAEYIWGLNTATSVREWIKIGEEIDLSEYATEDWVNEQISDFLPDAETYKTAELIEGQITDVIGVNDVLIKGNTSQDGEPTPNSPVDINMVSGSNVINTSSKNLFIPTLTYKGRNIEARNCTVSLQKDEFIFKASGSDMYFGYIGSTDTFFSNAYGVLYEVLNNKTIRFTLSNTIFNKNYIVKYDENKKILGYQQFNSNTGTITFANDVKYYSFRIGYGSAVSGTIYKTKVQVELGSTATTYEPHQDKEFPLDLPVENLLNLTDGTYTHNEITANVNKGIITLNGTASGTSAIDIPIDITIKANQAYTLEANNLSIIGQGGTGETYSCIRFITSDANDATSDVRFNPINNYTTFQKTEETTYAYLRIRTEDGLTYNNFIIKPQLEQGSKANAYTPYGTDPIELYKIGDYQDYFYKSESKWYLHKETNTKIFDKTYPFNKHGSYDNAFYGRANYLPDADCTQFANINIYSDKFQGTTKLETKADGLDYRINLASNGTNNPRIHRTDINSQAEFNNWLINNSFKVIYKLKEPINTEIIDTTLISQLEAIYNAPLYKQTNITQINNDLPIVLDITACKDNINGIKAFIRK